MAKKAIDLNEFPALTILLMSCPKFQLIHFCQISKIRGYSRKNKSELVSLLLYNAEKVKVLTFSHSSNKAFNKFNGKLPDTIDIFRNLQSLAISCSGLLFLPNTIGNLSKLENLTLSHSHITILPESIGNLSNLQNLRLYHTDISLLPKSIIHLKNLQKLEMSESKIEVIPQCIQFPKMKSFHYYGTPYGEQEMVDIALSSPNLPPKNVLNYILFRQHPWIFEILYQKLPSDHPLLKKIAETVKIDLPVGYTLIL